MTLPNTKKRKIFDGRYEIIALVGRGSDSVVYHARHVNSAAHEVALKVLHSNQNRASVTDRLRKEALTLVSCRHKYVVRLDDFHSVQDLCYLSMEYAPHGDLRRYLRELGQALPVEQGRVFLRQSIEALDFVHATGVIHRDIKPDNILVVSDKEIRLADFGMALLPGDDIDLEELKNGAGSLAYLPPELLEGIRYDARSDIYELGLCFYEALAGFHPFENQPLAQQLEVRRDGSIPPLHVVNPAVPEALSNVIAKMMRFEPERRFQTAAQALRALADPNFVDVEPTHEPVSTDFLAEEEREFEIISNNNPANEDFMQSLAEESEATPLYDDDMSSTATDVDDEDEGRERQRTEEFNLERIKSLVDQDAHNKSRAAEGKSFVDHRSRDFDHDRHERSVHTFETPRAIEQDRKAGGSATRRLAPAIRVAVGAALATIVLGLVYSRLFGGEEISSGDSTVADAGISAVSDENSGQEGAQTAPETFFFPHLQRGLYTGTIQGVIPSAATPISFISMPTRKSLVVILGIAGWTPVEVTVPDTQTPGSETIAVRSNGLILNITGELSGEAITGTFSNAVTGETGTWKASLVN